MATKLSPFEELSQFLLMSALTRMKSATADVVTG